MIEYRKTRILLENTDRARKNLGFVVGVWNKNSHRHSFLAVKDINATTIAIPRHTPLKEFHYSTGFDETSAVSISIPYKKVEHLKMKRGVGWHPTNKEHAKSQEEAYEFLMYYKTYPQRMLNLVTGTGKTFLAIKYLIEMGYKVVIVCHENHLLKQWTDEMKKFTNITDDDIHKIVGIKGGEDIIHRQKNLDKAIYLTTYRTLSLLDAKNPRYLDNMFRALQIGLKIFDEAHLETDALFKVDASCDIYETLYLTATPNRSNREENVIIDYILPREFSYDNHVEIEPYHNVMVIEYDSKPPLEVEFEIASKNVHGFNVHAWSKYIREERWTEFVAGITSLLQDSYKHSFKKTVIIFKAIDMIKEFYDEISEAFPEYTIGGFYGSGKNKHLELEKDIVLTTDKSMKAGIDIKELRLVINTVTYVSPVVAEQIIGRIREIKGKEVLYIDYADVGFDATKKQKNKRMKIYRILAKKIFKGKYPKKGN